MESEAGCNREALGDEIVKAANTILNQANIRLEFDKQKNINRTGVWLTR